MFCEIGVPKNFTIFSGIPVLKSVFMFPCEYWKIKLFYRTPLVAASVPCFFLKLFFKLFVHLNYLFHFLSKTLYLRFISKYLTFSCSFSVFLPNRQVSICSNSTIEQHMKYFLSHWINIKERRLANKEKSGYSKTKTKTNVCHFKFLNRV